MAALPLIQHLQQYLGSAGTLSSSSIGVAVPALTSDLPAIILSLANLQIPSVGLGQHTEIVSGALAAQTTIDLSNPLFEDDPSFSLLSPDRLVATLLHGGLVDQEGSSQPLQATDIQVAINGNPLTLNQNSAFPLAMDKLF